jgi:hypothetical protein
MLLNLTPLITVTAILSWFDTFLFLRVAIHSAVRVFTGEADEIATQHLRLLRLNFRQTVKSRILDAQNIAETSVYLVAMLKK